MKVVFHPDFAADAARFIREYRQISTALGDRFRQETEDAIRVIQGSPASAGHYLNTGSRIVRHVRRRNLRSFPFLILYGLTDGLLIIASLIPSRSDPL